MRVDLLMITWKRLPYVEKMLERLLGDPTDFRLYCWDNGSTDGTAELLRSVTDPRLHLLHTHHENVMQAEPTRWFLANATAELIGKVDDDTLVPTGWIEKISAAFNQHDELGMVGCWTFEPEDFERNRATAMRKVVDLGDCSLLHNAWIGGTAFLMRSSVATSYLVNGDGTSFPVDRLRMTRDGYLSGWYFPLLHAEHMDDPRSPNCMISGDGAPLALTAQRRGFSTSQPFVDWIKRDADKILNQSVRQQMALSRRKNMKRQLRKPVRYVRAAALRFKR